MYNIWCFLIDQAALKKEKVTNKKTFPWKKIRFRTAVDRSAAETMLLISSTEPNTANAVDDVIVSNRY